MRYSFVLALCLLIKSAPAQACTAELREFLVDRLASGDGTPESSWIRLNLYMRSGAEAETETLNIDGVYVRALSRKEAQRLLKMQERRQITREQLQSEWQAVQEHVNDFEIALFVLEAAPSLGRTPAEVAAALESLGRSGEMNNEQITSLLRLMDSHGLSAEQMINLWRRHKVTPDTSAKQVIEAIRLELSSPPVHSA